MSTCWRRGGGQVRPKYGVGDTNVDVTPPPSPQKKEEEEVCFFMCIFAYGIAV